MTAPVVELRGVAKTYRMGSVTVSALRDVDLDVAAGDMVAITGPSGSGKSTLMNIVGCLDRPSQGSYVLAGRCVDGLADDALAETRNRSIGFVFQSFHLLSRLSALENVELPLVYRGMGVRRRRALACQALADVGLEDRMHHLPAQLSGGQQQRVAVARALAGRPSLLLADEPTGNLDSRAGRDVLALFQGLNDEGMTVVVVTHDPLVARHCRRILSVADGLIAGCAEVAAGERLLAAAAAPGGDRA